MSDERQRDIDTKQRSGDNRSGDNRSGDGMPDETPDFEGHRDVDLARDTPRSDDGQDIGRDVDQRNID